MPPPTPIPTLDPAIFLWFFFVIGMLFTAYFLFAHLYHWIRYAPLYPLVWIAMPLYLGGVLLLVTTMLGAIALV